MERVAGVGTEICCGDSSLLRHGTVCVAGRVFPDVSKASTVGIFIPRSGLLDTEHEGNVIVETSGDTYPVTQPDIPEDDLERRRYKNVESRNVVVVVVFLFFFSS